MMTVMVAVLRSRANPPTSLIRDGSYQKVTRSYLTASWID